MLGEPVVVIRDGTATGTLDAYRRPIVGADVEHTERGAAFAPVGTVETITVGRDAVTTRDTLYFTRPGVDIVAADRVSVRGVVRDVDGDPERWVDPFNGREVGLVVRLKSTEG